MDETNPLPVQPPSTGKQQLQGHLRPEFAQAPFVSELDPTTRLDLAISLPLRNYSQLEALVQDISDPKSQNYRQYLTPAQFGEQFGPTEQDYQALVAFCEQAEGLTITNRYANSGVLDVAGAASAIQSIFHINLTVRRRPDGSTFYAPDREPSLDLDVPVLHISGLDDYIRPVAHAGSAPNGEFGGSDFRNAYAPDITLTGQGQTVGLYSANGGFYTADVNAYKNRFNLNVPVQVVTLNGYSQTASQSGPKGTPGFNQGETSLDIEMAMAMAPGLQSVVVYEGSNQDSILAAMASPPPGIPLSYQLNASYTFAITAKSQELITQMAAQGQTFFVAAGDGRALCPGEVGDSRSLNNVTVVGGTYLVMNGSGVSWKSETAGSNGGGIETGVPIPSYQKGLATAANGGSNQWRNVPDVAMVASNVFIFANNGQQQAVGGTSVAAPLWAGYIALVNEQRQLEGVNPVGFINPTLYLIGSVPAAYARDFHDIQSGGSKLTPAPCAGYIGYNATVGYDLASGLGTPTAALLDDLAFPPWQFQVVEVRLQAPGWIQADLADFISDKPAIPIAGAPFAYVTPDKVPRVVYRGTNNHLIECRLQSTGWIQADLADFISDKPAIPMVSDPFAYVTPDGVPRVVYSSQVILTHIFG